MEAQSAALGGARLGLTYLLGEDCELRLPSGHKPKSRAFLGYTNGWHDSTEGDESDSPSTQLPEAQDGVLGAHLVGGLGEEVDGEGEEGRGEDAGEGFLYLGVPLPVLDSLSGSDEPLGPLQGGRSLLLPVDGFNDDDIGELEGGGGDAQGLEKESAGVQALTVGVHERGSWGPGLGLAAPAPTAGQVRKWLLWQSLLEAREGTAERKGVSLIPPPPEPETAAPPRVWRSQAGADASRLAAEGRLGSASPIQRTPVWIPVDTTQLTVGGTSPASSTSAPASNPGAPGMPAIGGSVGVGSIGVVELPGLKARLDGAPGVVVPGHPVGKEGVQQLQVATGGQSERCVSPGELQQLSARAAQSWAQAMSASGAAAGGDPELHEGGAKVLDAEKPVTPGQSVGRPGIRKAGAGPQDEGPWARGLADGVLLAPQAWVAEVDGRQLVVQAVLKVTDVRSGRQFIVENWARAGGAPGALKLPPGVDRGALADGVQGEKGGDADNGEEGGGVQGATRGSPSIRSRRKGSLDRRASLSSNAGEGGAPGISPGGGSGKGGQGRARVGTRLSRSGTRRHSGRLTRAASSNRGSRMGSMSGRGTPPAAEGGAALGTGEGGYADNDDGGYEDDDEGGEGGEGMEWEGQEEEAGEGSGSTALSRRRGRTRSLSGNTGALAGRTGGASEEAPRGSLGGAPQKAWARSAHPDGDASEGPGAQESGEGKGRGEPAQGREVGREAEVRHAEMSFRDLSTELAGPTASEADGSSAQGEGREGRDLRDGVSAQGSGSAEATAPTGAHSGGHTGAHREDLEQEGLEAQGQEQGGAAQGARVQTRVRGRKRAALLKAVKRVAGYSGSSLGSSSGLPGVHPGSVSASPAPSSLAGGDDGGATVPLTDRSHSVNDPALLFPSSTSSTLRPPPGPLRAVTTGAGSGIFVGLGDGETALEFRSGADPFGDGQPKGVPGSVTGAAAGVAGTSGGVGAATRVGSLSEVEARGSDSSVPSQLGSEAYRGRARESSASSSSFSFAPNATPLASHPSSHLPPAPPVARTRRMERVKVQPSSKKAPVKHLSDLWLVQEVQAHTGAIWALQFSSNGRLLATGGQDHVVKLWEIEGVPGGASGIPGDNLARDSASAPDSPAVQTPGSTTPAASTGTPSGSHSGDTVPVRGWQGPGAATGAPRGPRDRSMKHSASESSILAAARGSGGAYTPALAAPPLATSGLKDPRGGSSAPTEGFTVGVSTIGLGPQQSSSSSPQLGALVPDPLQVLAGPSPHHLAAGAAPATGSQGHTSAHHSHAPVTSASFGAAGMRALGHSGHYAGASAGGVPGVPGAAASPSEGAAVQCAMGEHPLRSFTGHTGAVIDLSWSSSCQVRCTPGVYTLPHCLRTTCMATWA